jgi:cytochrome c
MKRIIILAAAGFALAAPAYAAGDIEAGKKVFNQCQTCHVVANEAGDVLAGRNSKTGPNLYGVFGRAAGSYPDFKYGDDMIAAGAKGLVWDEANFLEYVASPSKFLQAYLEDPKAKGKMQFQLKKPEDAANVYAFIASLAPAAAPAADAAAAPAADAAAAPAADAAAAPAEGEAAPAANP